MGTRQRTSYANWSDELKHRQCRIAKLEKIQGLEALLATWESAPADSDDYRAYIRDLKAKIRSARCQYEAMKL